MSNKREEMLKLREQGLTYEQIAKELGVTKQYVGAMLAGYAPYKFHFITEKGCIYPNLRAWMNKNKVSRSEFIRRMGLTNSPLHYTTSLGHYMRGVADPPKWFIDKMLEVTGLTYEQLFYEEVREV